MGKHVLHHHQITECTTYCAPKGRQALQEFEVRNCQMILSMKIFILFLFFNLFNSFTALACKISGAGKCTHPHLQTVHLMVLYGYNKSDFNTVHVDIKSFICSCEGGIKALMVSNMAQLLVIFQVTAWQAWQ